MTRNYTTAALIVALAWTGIAAGQNWTSKLTSERPDFHEVQQAFNSFWAPYDVHNGWYTDADGRRHKAPGWKQFKRWEQYWEVRTGPTGKFPGNTIECDEWEKYSKGGAAGSAKAASNWSSMGPSTSSNIAGIGRINCIAFHPTNANTMWVGTPAGGLWKTTNGGSSWTTNTDDLPVLGVSSIAIHPTTPNTMYIATGDGDAAITLSAFGHTFAGDTKSIGILKSTDGGNSWSQVLAAEQWDGILIRKVMIDPAYPDYVYAATSIGIFQTSDGGANWYNILGGYFMDLEFNPGNSDIVYAASYDPGGGAQIFVSYDYGQNWAQATALTGVSRIDLAVCPASPSSVDALCSDASTNGLHSLYYSMDDGANWAPYWFGGAGSNLLGWYGDASDVDGQGKYDLTLAIDPADYDNIYVGGVNLWRTMDAGANWSLSNMWTDDPWYYPPPGTPVVHADKHHVAFHPSLANTIFDCNDGGVFKSTDGGDSWTNITNGIVNSQLYSISCAQTTPDLVLAGLQDNGSIGYELGSWEQLTQGDGMVCHIDPTDANYLYTSYSFGVIYRITLSPPTFTTISENLPGGQQDGKWVTPYQLDPNDPSVIFACYEGVYRSNDRGDSWSLLATPVPGVKINYLAIAPSNSNTLYIGYQDAVYRSFNGGINWDNVTGSLPTGSVYISGIQVDPADANAVIITLSGYDAGNKVYVSINAGDTWGNVTATGLPNLPVNCAELDPATGATYLGTDAGIYVWDGSSSSWIEDNAGLPNVVVTDLDLQHASGLLRAGTFGRGLWETSTLNVGLVKPEDQGAIEVYPNPSKGRFIVQLGDLLDEVRSVELANNLGQVIWQQGGSSGQRDRVEVDAGEIPAGVYVLNVVTAKERHVRRIVIER